MVPTFHIASLNRYTPNFSGVTPKLTWCQQFGLQVLPKWGDADFLLLKRPFLGVFWTKYIFPAKRSTFAYSTRVLWMNPAANISFPLLTPEAAGFEPTTAGTGNKRFNRSAVSLGKRVKSFPNNYTIIAIKLSAVKKLSSLNNRFCNIGCYDN